MTLSDPPSVESVRSLLSKLIPRADQRIRGIVVTDYVVSIVFSTDFKAGKLGMDELSAIVEALRVRFVEVTLWAVGTDQVEVFIDLDEPTPVARPRTSTPVRGMPPLDDSNGD